MWRSILYRHVSSNVSCFKALQLNVRVQLYQGHYHLSFAFIKVRIGMCD
jgi:hypothetical protein